MSELQDEGKRELIRILFEQNVPSDERDQRDLRDYEAYFDNFDAGLKSLNTHQTYVELQLKVKAEDVAEIAFQAVPTMQRSPDATKGSVLCSLRQKLKEKHPGEEPWISLHGGTGEAERNLTPAERRKRERALELALDTVVRLWLMIEPSPRGYEGTEDGNGWRGQRGLSEFAKMQFYPCQAPPAGEGTREPQVHGTELTAEMIAEAMQVQLNLTHPLTVANMKKLTNIAIIWDSFLPEHLGFDADIRALTVFPHNRWLFDALAMIRAWKKESPQRRLCPFPIPVEVIEEAIKSLNLLFPPYNKPTNRFLRKHNERLYNFRLRSDEIAPNRVGSKVRLREFAFYHDRLIELAQEFTNPPKDWNTIFRDYRNPIQYWTFWIGLVIFIATVVSIALGGAQVYYAQHAA